MYNVLKISVYCNTQDIFTYMLPWNNHHKKITNWEETLSREKKGSFLLRIQEMFLWIQNVSVTETLMICVSQKKSPTISKEPVPSKG